MNRAPRDRSLGDGVYYSADDYIGITPRLLILLVDSIVLAMIVFVIAFVWLLVLGGADRVLAAVLIAAIWLYAVPLKRSTVRTPGYWLAGAKLVTLKGEQPSLVALTLRSVLWMFGPFNLLLDLLWCSADPDRQSMRDRFTYMCVVRNRAMPIGTGEVHLAYFTAVGYTLAYPRVVHPKTAGLQTS